MCKLDHDAAVLRVVTVLFCGALSSILEEHQQNSDSASHHVTGKWII